MATVRTAELEVLPVDGAISVSFRKRGKEWYATALQFDLVGTGTSRDEALRELQTLFEAYVNAVIGTKGRTRFYNPSEAEEWEVRDKQHFRAVCIVTAPLGTRTSVTPSLDDIGSLRRIRSRIHGVRLSPFAAG